MADKKEAGEEEEGMWDGWGYMRAKKRKLREQFDMLDQKPISEIFRGVTVYVNGWTQPNADELKRLIHSHGGRYEYNLYGDSSVTHTIATNLPNAKIRNLKDTCVCTPNWIVDSVAAGKRLPVKNYLLYDRHGIGQKKLKFTEIKNSPTSVSGNQDEGTTFSAAIAPKQVTPPKPSQTDSLEKLIPKAKSSHVRSYDAKEGAEFVSDYYAYSRLHYLSTWSMELKQFTSKMLPQVTPKYPKLLADSSLRRCKKRVIVHIDLDCFFVSVSLQDKPHLKGKPVAVCHAKLPKGKSQECQQQDGSSLSFQPDKSASGDDGPIHSESTSLPQYLLKSMSDIASCSYEARSAGLHNGMFVGEALKLCPELQLLPYEFDKYHEVSKKFYTILMSYSATIEAVSCDEAYIELTDYVRTIEEAVSIVQDMRDEIKTSTGCTASAGMAQNMLLARMATRVAKPSGQYFLSGDAMWDFLGDQKVHDLPGVGYSTALKLREAGVETCSQLRQLSNSRLKSDFGVKIGQMLYDYCRGTDKRELRLVSERKSLSVDLNFGIRFQTLSDAENLLKNLSEELERRALEAKVVGGTLTLKLMIRKPEAPTETRKYLGHGQCNNMSRSCSLLQPTGEATEICRLAVRLLKQINPSPEDIRGVGVQLTRLVSSQLTGNGRCDLRNMLTTKPQPPSVDPSQDLPPLPNLSSPTKSPLKHVPSDVVSRASPFSLDDTFVIDIPPASQLDSSVLEALPQDMREKILRSYAKLEQASEPSAETVSTSGNVQKSPSHLPGGESKGGRGRGGRGGRGRGRGRGKGTASPNRSPQKQVGLRTTSVRVSEMPPEKQKRLIDFTNVTDASGAVEPTLLQSDDAMHATPSVTLEHDDEVVPSDEGIIIDDDDQFLSDFRAYLKEWVCNTPKGPLESDLKKVTDYFIRLYNNKRSDILFVILLGLRRHILNHQCMGWSAAFNHLLEAIQSRVQLDYNGTLPVEKISI